MDDENLNQEPGEEQFTRLPHVARGAIINFSGTVSRMVLVYAYTFLLARMLTADELGQYFIMFTIINLVGAAALVGLDLGVVRYVSIFAGQKNYDLARKSLRSGLLVGIPVGLLFTLGLYVAAPKLSDMFLEGSATAITPLRIFALAIPFMVVARLFNSTTQGMHMMRYQVYSRDMGEQSVKLVISAAVLALGAGILGVVYANVAAVVFATALSLVFVLRVLPKTVAGAGTTGVEHEVGGNQTATPLKAMLRYSMPLAFASILVAIWLQIDKLLLGYLGTTASVGFYGVAMSLAIFSSKIITAFAVVFTPIISDLWNRKKREELEALFKTVTRWIFTLTLPIFLVLAIFADAIMRVFGTDFVAGDNALILLALGQLFNAATGVCGLMIIMAGRSGLELLNVIVTLVIDVALCFLLIPTYGIVGAAIANMVCLLVVNMMRVVEIWSFMRMHAYDRSYIKPILAAVAAVPVMILISRYLIVGTGIKQLVGLASILFIIYVSAIVVLGLEGQDKAMLKKIRTSAMRLREA